MCTYPQTKNQVGLEPDIPPATAEETVWKGGEKQLHHERRLLWNYGATVGNAPQSPIVGLDRLQTRSACKIAALPACNSTLDTQSQSQCVTDNVN